MYENAKCNTNNTVFINKMEKYRQNMLMIFPKDQCKHTDVIYYTYGILDQALTSVMVDSIEFVYVVTVVVTV